MQQRRHGILRLVEGVKKYSHLHGLLPRLGFFIGNENKIPVDFTEIISIIAPRPLLVIAPELDRHADFGNVKQSIHEMRTVYSLFNVSRNLEFKTPHVFNIFTSSQQKDMVNWLDRIAGRDRKE